ncbi:sugar phosphate isomerase/epimerase family protein [Amnibacterium kyonggiense]|uniref:sugar phosphate isomerase/epimerase family protein n=1 Tax=Amnibacterium kyonggiense TaxID=595671 RepID=UPI00105E69B9|nr:sugar phosphate isomerase/epimerase [Amnibacterium kyonggiense]
MALPVASVQLYTLADLFAADMQGSLERLAAIGLKNVEAFDFVRRPREIRAALDAAGLASPTGHAPLLSDTLWTPDGSIPTPKPEVVFEAAATIGMTTVIDPFVPVERWLTEDGVQDLADRMNAAAEVAAGFGLTVGYHNHAQEFIASFDGRTAYERFVELTDDRVALELDLFWALTGGQDPVALTASLGDRLVAQHVKDGVAPDSNPFAPGAPAFGSDSLDQRRAGEGDVPLADALRAATALQYAVIEYDHAPGDVFEDVAASYAFLTEGGFVR